eukprot:8791649-Pyramimonas_sp.AAC.1
MCQKLGGPPQGWRPRGGHRRRRGEASVDPSKSLHVCSRLGHIGGKPCVQSVVVRLPLQSAAGSEQA